MVQRGRVLDGQVRCHLIGVVGRVTAFPHYRNHQRMRLDRRRSGGFDELFLDERPALGIPGPRGGIQRPDVQIAHPPLACGEFCLRLPPALVLFHSPVIFRPEPLLQLAPAAPGCLGCCDDDDDHDDNGGNCPSGHGGLPGAGIRTPPDSPAAA